MMGISKITAAFVFCLVITAASGAIGQALPGHADAYNDGNGPQGDGSWSGAVGFSVSGSGSTLAGTIDFAVFTKQKFLDNFAGDGYVPDAPLVYTYQVHNTGTTFVSAQIQGAVNPISNVDWFEIGDGSDVDPSSSANVGGNAVWDFLSPAISSGSSSEGLAFSAAGIPDYGFALTQNGGLSFVSAGLPTPGSGMIPEPATIILVGVGAGLLATWRGRRRVL